MYDIIIIGGGPAGLTAAVYALRANKTVLVLEKGSFGGQITYSPKVENIPGFVSVTGNEFAEKLVEQALELGAEIEPTEVFSVKNGEIKTVVTEDGDYEAKAVIIATGAKHRLLGIENEENLIGNGISFCAVCDGAFFRGQKTIVVGGGNTALEDAEFLSNFCEKVYVVHRRDEFRGEQWLVNTLSKKENVEFVMDSVVTEILGDRRVEGARIKNVKTDALTELEVTGIFVAIGQMPDNKAFEDLVDLDGGGYIRGQEDCRTSCEGVFVAGDCRTKVVRQLATATADGAVAGLAACEYVNKNN